MKQFRLANVKPRADGKHVTAVIVDPDWDRFTEHPEVSVIQDTDEGPLVMFPAHMRWGSILDLDR